MAFLIGQKNDAVFNKLSFENSLINCDIGRHRVIVWSSYSFEVTNRLFYSDGEFDVFVDGFLFGVRGNFGEHILRKLRAGIGINELSDTLNGSFTCLVIDKARRKVFVVCDHLATKKVFFNSNAEVVSDSLELCVRGRRLELDVESIYRYLVMGFYVADETSFKDYFKLRPLNLLKLSEQDGIALETYGSLGEIREPIEVNRLKTELYQAFSESIDDMIFFNESIDKESSSSLSGGLDAKTVVYSLASHGRNRVRTITFAQSQSLDHKIAETVARKLGTDHFYRMLDGGNYLIEDVENYVVETSGLIPFCSSIHTFSTLSMFSSNCFGVHLSGQIGDVIFGSFPPLNEGALDFTKFSYIGKSPEFLRNKAQVNSFFSKKYEGYFHNFNFFERQSNGTILGDVALKSRLMTCSPFYNRRMVELSFQFPDDCRKDEALYIDWLSEYYSGVLEFNFDKAIRKPGKSAFYSLSKFSRRVVNFIKRKLNCHSYSMNPIDLWVKENPRILSFLNNSFETKLHFLDSRPDLKEDVENFYYFEGDRMFRNKFAVVTLLIFIEKVRVHSHVI